jgi:hypothetical protein
MHTLVKLFLAVCVFGFVGAGCASNTKTVRTETTHYPDAAPTVVEKETTITTTETEGNSGGVVSGTVNVLGDVIALPFRAVGGLISAVF